MGMSPRTVLQERGTVARLLRRRWRLCLRIEGFAFASRLGALALLAGGRLGGATFFFGLERARVVGPLIRRITPERYGAYEIAPEAAAGKGED